MAWSKPASLAYIHIMDHPPSIDYSTLYTPATINLAHIQAIKELVIASGLRGLSLKQKSIVVPKFVLI